MVNMSSRWDQFLAMAGNEPGMDEGDVTVHLSAPVAGMSSFTCPSSSLTVAAEAGQLIGLSVVLEDGRHLFVAGANVAGIIDADPDRRDD